MERERNELAWVCSCRLVSAVSFGKRVHALLLMMPAPCYLSSPACIPFQRPPSPGLISLFALVRARQEVPDARLACPASTFWRHGQVMGDEGPIQLFSRKAEAPPSQRHRFFCGLVAIQ